MRKNDHGFTLIEMLVVMAITAVVGTLLVVIFSNTLRGSNKSQMLAVIKQNGQAVLEGMDKTIRNADKLVCPLPSSADPTRLVPDSNTVMTKQDKIYTRYRVVRFDDASGTAPPSCLGVNANGCIIVDYPAPVAGSDLQALCNTSELMSSAEILTDTNTQTGVAVESGKFSISKPPGSHAAVTIDFKLKPGAGLPTEIRNQIEAVTFHTTVQIRND